MASTRSTPASPTGDSSVANWLSTRLEEKKCEVGQRIGPDAELGLVAWREQNLLMADRPAQTFGFKVDFTEQMRRGLAQLLAVSALERRTGQHHTFRVSAQWLAQGSKPAFAVGIVQG